MREIVNSKELKSAREGFRSMCLENFTRTLLAVVCCAGLMPFALSAESLRVGTWNIRLSDMDRWDKHAGAPNWRERMPSAAAALKARNCDLVGLQECSTPQAEFLRAELPDSESIARARAKLRRACGSIASGRRDRFTRRFWRSSPIRV